MKKILGLQDLRIRICLGERERFCILNKPSLMVKTSGLGDTGKPRQNSAEVVKRGSWVGSHVASL